MQTHVLRAGVDQLDCEERAPQRENGERSGDAASQRHQQTEAQMELHIETEVHRAARLSNRLRRVRCRRRLRVQP